MMYSAVRDIIMNLKEFDPIVISYVVEKKEVADFVNKVKEFIDKELDIKNGFEIEFNSDYSKLRKRKLNP